MTNTMESPCRVLLYICIIESRHSLGCEAILAATCVVPPCQIYRTSCRISLYPRPADVFPDASRLYPQQTSHSLPTNPRMHPRQPPVFSSDKPTFTLRQTSLLPSTGAVFILQESPPLCPTVPDVYPTETTNSNFACLVGRPYLYQCACIALYLCTACAHTRLYICKTRRMHL